MLERIIKGNYEREQAGYRRKVVQKSDCANNAQWDAYKENISVYKSMLSTWQIGDSVENLDAQLTEICRIVGREDFDSIKEILAYNCHSMLIKKTMQDSKGYTEEGNALLKDNENRRKEKELELQTIVTALENNKKLKNADGVVLSKTAMKELVEELEAELDVIAEERKGLFNSNIYKATSFKDVSDANFRRTFETIYGSMVSDNGAKLKEWFDPAEIRLGGYWSDLKTKWEKCGLDMAVFYEFVTRKYRDGDKSASNECKAMIKAYKAEQAEKAKAEKPQAGKPVDKMNKAELIAKGAELGLQLSETLKNKEMIQLIKAEKAKAEQENTQENEQAVA